MASRTLYPAIVNSYMPAFQVLPNVENECTILFSLSKFNSSNDVKEVHISVTRQDSGLNMVNSLAEDTENRFCKTGIILVDGTLNVVGDNLYSITVYDSELTSSTGEYQGWIPGDLYKVQLRLSSVAYNEREDEDITQSEWLNIESNEFSEWSTICVVKPIGNLRFTIPTFDYVDINPSTATLSNYPSTSIEFVGSMESLQDSTETLYSYRLSLYKGSVLVEDSGIILADKYQNVNKFNYLFKSELLNNNAYKIIFDYTTNNEYSSSIVFNFNVAIQYNTGINAYVATIENDADNVMWGITTVSKEEDEGRIGLKIYSEENNNYTGILVIRRSDSKSNFTSWVDIKTIECNTTDLNDFGLFYDYTIESGVWYLYALQTMNNGRRSVLLFPESQGVEMRNPSMRNFEYSFLLGEDNQQLKLMFDNTMGSYKIQQMESKFETIGSKHPYISRNAKLGYRIFPVNGLISYMMDENKLFCDQKVIYTYDDIVNLYKDYNDKNRICYNNNYIYERDFRHKVIEFLTNGKPKLFKSPTEGNIIVRLTDINFTPNQNLDRMIYSFTSTGNEIAEDGIPNYIKYRFLDLYTIKSEEENAGTSHVHAYPDANDSPTIVPYS